MLWVGFEPTIPEFEQAKTDNKITKYEINGTWKANAVRWELTPWSTILPDAPTAGQEPPNRDLTRKLITYPEKSASGHYRKPKESSYSPTPIPLRSIIILSSTYDSAFRMVCTHKVFRLKCSCISFSHTCYIHCLFHRPYSDCTFWLFAYATDGVWRSFCLCRVVHGKRNHSVVSVW
jgi:hypothetical protein